MAVVLPMYGNTRQWCWEDGDYARKIDNLGKCECESSFTFGEAAAVNVDGSCKGICEENWLIGIGDARKVNTCEYK